MKPLHHHQFFYPLLMGISAGLMSLSSHPEVHLQQLHSTGIHFLLISSITFIAYYTATLKPAIFIPPNSGRGIKLPGKILLSLLIPVVCLFLLQPAPILLFQYLLAAILTLSYYLVWHTPQGKFHGTRSLFLIKNLILAICWALVTSPVHPGENITLLLFLQRFLYILVLSLLIDMRDIHHDRQQSVDTLAARFGIPATKIISVILLSLATAFIYYHHLHYQAHFLQPALISHALTLVALLFLSKDSGNDTYLLLVDGNLLLHGILFYLFS
jgi:4-hydroxybenzoate polyprenyltransferase